VICYIAADHAGYELKQEVLRKYPDMINLGTNSLDAVDYPDFAYKVADNLKQSDQALGILICGTGSGMCVAANRFRHIRAVNCLSVEMAKLAKEHNDANVLCLGARLVDRTVVLSIIATFLSTSFSCESRHQNRISKMS